MTTSPSLFAATHRPQAHPDAVVEGPGFRITVLTSRLLRLERQEDNRFTDEATQLVLSRELPVPEFTVSRDGEGLDLWTDDLHLHYDGGEFSPAGLSVTMRRRAQDSHRTTWRYGDRAEDEGLGANLGGTARTLDDVDGATALEPGLLSRTGYAVVDDSSSLVLHDDGWVSPRPAPETDLYFFGYGRDYAAALRDWFTLTGPNPLLPRWALGNWWSRYHRYSDEEYVALMDRFADAGIPFSVAVLDMDWHLVDIDPALGAGWTGYTWNPELFPDPAGFLRQLHERGLRVTLNVHPADGVRRHEAAYDAMARELGLDPEAGLAIAFDLTSRDFVDAYFRHLHHPHEEIGVDFWWLDWQSGSTTRVPGLDPLWMLNHLHYLDSGRDGHRPLTFSRYAGLGSHRYPVGFSGDTLITWASLDFQPYFTATAANVGYHWWSHDVGGHLGGAKDDELATRWFQLGVFSPVNRLHSSASPFNSKEPWRFGREAERIMTRYLRLRHQLVPYLYTAMWASHSDGTAPVRPMYHAHPTAPEAYAVPNQYLFGADLLVAPVTRPVDPATLHAEVTATVWGPEHATRLARLLGEGFSVAVSDLHLEHLVTDDHGGRQAAHGPAPLVEQPGLPGQRLAVLDDPHDVVAALAQAAGGEHVHLAGVAVHLGDLPPQLDAPAAYPGDIEQVLDEAGEMPHLPRHDLQVLVGSHAARSWRQRPSHPLGSSLQRTWRPPRAPLAPTPCRCAASAHGRGMG